MYLGECCLHSYTDYRYNSPIDIHKNVFFNHCDVEGVAVRMLEWGGVYMDTYLW